ncbi:PAS domain-containing hybrid sensor histidine kinase/response regulator [Spirochaeta dissipatitropha]
MTDNTDILHTTPIPIAVHELILDDTGQAVDYRFTECNKAFAELLHSTREKIIGQTVTKLLPETAHDKAGWIPRYARVATEGTPEIFEDYSVALSRWFRVHAFQTNPGFFATIAEDITRQHLLNQEILLRRKSIEDLSGAVGDVVFHCQLFPSFRLNYVSPSVLEISGYTPEELYESNKMLYKIIHPEDRNRIRSMLEQPDQLPPQFRMRWKSRDDRTIWISLHNILQRDAENRVIGMDAIASDISAEKLTEDALELNQIQFSQILSSVSDMVIYYEKDTLEIAWANQKAEQSLHSTRGTLHGQKCYSLWGSNRNKVCENCPVLRCFESHKEEWVERNLPDRRQWSIHASPVFSPSGKFIGVVETARDISTRLRMEAELQNALDKADSASLVKDQFIANISHELRTPLNGIIGISELIDIERLEPDQRDLLKLIRESGHRLHDVVQEILSFSQLDHNQLRDKQIRFRITTVCNEIFSQYREAALKKKLDFSFTVDPEIPDWLIGYPGKIRQLLKPLIDNAVKFTSKGFAHLHIDLVQRNPLHLKFTVMDSGCGIPDHAMSRIFEPFFQADASLTRSFGGIGLGLALARRQARELSTEISIQSRLSGPQKGTDASFVIRIDALYSALYAREKMKDNITGKQTMNQDYSSQNRTSSTERRLNHSGSKTQILSPVLDILIVEDDLINQRVTDALLRSQGHRTSIASNGVQAIKELSEHHFDLVLMDIQMPEMDGLEASRIIRSSDSSVLNHDIPIIAVSAFSMEDEKNQCLNAGINTFLGKPVSPAKLAQLIAELASSP